MFKYFSGLFNIFFSSTRQATASEKEINENLMKRNKTNYKEQKKEHRNKRSIKNLIKTDDIMTLKSHFRLNCFTHRTGEQKIWNFVCVIFVFFSLSFALCGKEYKATWGKWKKQPEINEMKLIQ